MIPQILENNELGLSLNYWQGQKKNECVFLAKQIAEQLGYKNISVTLTRLNLAEGIDKVRTEKINKALKNPVWIRFNPDNPKFNLGEVINRIILIYHDELLDLKFEGYKLPTCQISEAKQLIKQVALLNMIHSNCAN